MKHNIRTYDYFDDDIDASAADRRERIYANDDVELRPSGYTHVRVETYPPRLSKEEVAQLGEIDGWIDACLNRPMGICLRFVEQRLHEENMGAFQSFADSYQAAYRRKTRAA